MSFVTFNYFMINSSTLIATRNFYEKVFVIKITAIFDHKSLELCTYIFIAKKGWLT